MFSMEKRTCSGSAFFMQFFAHQPVRQPDFVSVFIRKSVQKNPGLNLMSFIGIYVMSGPASFRFALKYCP